MELKTPVLPKTKAIKLRLLSSFLLLLLLMGCRQPIPSPPSFIKESIKSTEIFDKELMLILIGKFKRGTLNSDSFKRGVEDFEKDYYRRRNKKLSTTPEYFLKATDELHYIYKELKGVCAPTSTEALYVREIFVRILESMLEGVSFKDKSEILGTYYVSMKVVEKDFDFEYVLSVYDLIVDRLAYIDGADVPMTELKEIQTTLLETGSPFKKRDLRLGLRGATKKRDDIIFVVDSRLLEIENLRRQIEKARETFIRNDSTYDLLLGVKTITDYTWLSSDDYPYILGDGFVEVIPADTYAVKQYGKLTEKRYRFEQKTYSYKRTGDKWIYGHYRMDGCKITLTIGKYDTTTVTFKITDGIYILGSEILIREDK